MRLLLITLALCAVTNAQAASTCYLYDGDDYWNCLIEERADQQEQEELKEEISREIAEQLEEVLD